MTQVKQGQLKQKILDQKQSGKSSSLISSQRSNSSESSVTQSKYQKKQLQSSKGEVNGIIKSDRSKQPQVIKQEIQKKYSFGSRSPSSSSEKESRSHRKQKRQKRHRSRQTSDSFRSRDNRKDKYRAQRYRDQKQKKSNKYHNDRDKNRDRDRDRSRNPQKDRDRQREREKQRDRKNKRDYKDRDEKYRDRGDRGRSRDKNRNDKRETQKHPQKESNQTKNNNSSNNKLHPHEIPMPIQVPMPLIPGERRRRQRSRSPLGYYRRNQSNNQGEFWDSFSWVPRINYTPNVSSSALVNTKKMRRLMITNIPYEIGITKDDLRQLITRFMSQNYLKDSMNNCPVRELEIDQQEHSVAVELSSVEQTCRMCKLQKIQLFKGAINGIIRLGDSCYGNNIVTQAQNAAQAQAAAFAAINVLENKKTNFNMDINLNKGVEVSTMIRVTNAVTAYMAENMTPEQMDDYHEDLLEGFSLYGKIVHNWFVKPSEKDICANAGDLFIQYQAQEDAVKAMNEMQGKFYDERVIKLYYIPRQIYYPNFKKDLTPPAIKAPPKVKKQPVSNVPQISKSAHIATKVQ